MFEGKNFALIKENRLFTGAAQKLKIPISNQELLSAPAGDVIYQPGDESDALFLVISGEVRVEIPGILSKPVVIKKKANDFFGEKEFIEKQKRKGTASASSDSYICVLKKEKIEKLIIQDKQIYSNLYRIISDHEGGFEFTAENDITSLNGDFRNASEQEEVGEKDFEDIFNVLEEELGVIPEELDPSLEDLKLEADREYDSIASPAKVEDDKISDADTDEIAAGDNGKARQEEDYFYPTKEDRDLSAILNDEEIEAELDLLNKLDLPENDSERDEDALEDELDKKIKNIDLDSLPDEPEVFTLLEDEPKDKGVPAEEEELPAFNKIPPKEGDTSLSFTEEEEDFSDIELIELDEIKSEEITGIDAISSDIPLPTTNKIIDPKSAEPEEEVDINKETPAVNKRKPTLSEKKPAVPKESFQEPPKKSAVSIEKAADDLLDQWMSEPVEVPKPKRKKTSDKKQPEAPKESKHEERINQKELTEEVDEMTAAQFKKLLETARKINSGITLDETLQSVLDAAKNITDAENGYLYILDSDTNELWCNSPGKKIGNGSRIKIGEDISGIAAETNKIINLKNAYEDERFDQSKDKLHGTITKSLLAFPVVNKNGSVSAVLQLTNSSKGEFTPSDEEALSALSLNISLALENAELIEKQLQNDRVSSMGKMANFLIQDIKKPVQTIKYYAEHIKKKEVAADVVQILNMLIEQSNAVVDLVQTTLSYSEGKGILRTQPIRLSAALEDIFNLLAEYVESRHANLYKKFEADAVVNLDKREFYQACFQIVKNACDAMPKGGDIYVSVKTAHGAAILEFKDSGVGIPESIKSKIFEPFMSYGKKQGVGLGLAIAEKIVKDHNGTISFQSEVGEGTSFIISLPYISVA